MKFLIQWVRTTLSKCLYVLTSSLRVLKTQIEIFRNLSLISDWIMRMNSKGSQRLSLSEMFADLPEISTFTKLAVIGGLVEKGHAMAFPEQVDSKEHTINEFLNQSHYLGFFYLIWMRAYDLTRKDLNALTVVKFVLDGTLDSQLAVMKENLVEKVKQAIVEETDDQALLDSQDYLDSKLGELDPDEFRFELRGGHDHYPCVTFGIEGILCPDIRIQFTHTLPSDEDALEGSLASLDMRGALVPV